MLGDRLVRLLIKLPVPVPSVVVLSLIVGLCDVLQQTPRAVTASPPSEVTLPPPDAVVAVIEEMAVAVTVGVVVAVIKLSSLLYSVPTEFVA